LPCGRYYLDEISGTGAIQLRVEGRVALFVGGNVQSLGRLRVELGAGAELDWFIGGTITMDLERAAHVGDVERPAALRVFVAGEGRLPIAARYAFGNFYAPRSDLTLLGGGEFYGSLFGRTVSSVDAIVVHYDVAIQRLNEACGSRGSANDDGSPCAGAACAMDAECPWPLVCRGGRCSAFAK
jgi:hypothetical protein